jgi:mRNA interferase MazF
VTAPLRGQIFHVDLGHGRKPWLVVSNNARNRNLDSVLAAHITTTRKHAALPTVVPLSAADPLTGFVLCDDIAQLYHDELATPAGLLSAPTITAVSEGLRNRARAALTDCAPLRRQNLYVV